jgi:hypothetical protein
MENQHDNFWGEPSFRYSRAQAIADGMLVDLTSATDDKGQPLCQQAGFKVPVAISRAAWAQTIEVGGTWKPAGDGEVLELKNGQSLTGRLWDLLWMMRVACGQSGCVDRVEFQVLVDVDGNGASKPVRLRALCGPGDDARPVITVMMEGED